MLITWAPSHAVNIVFPQYIAKEKTLAKRIGERGKGEHKKRLYLVKDGHGELLVGDTVRGVTVVLVVLVRDVVVDPIQYVLLKQHFLTSGSFLI